LIGAEGRVAEILVVHVQETAVGSGPRLGVRHVAVVALVHHVVEVVPAVVAVLETGPVQHVVAVHDDDIVALEDAAAGSVARHVQQAADVVPVARCVEDLIGGLAGTGGLFSVGRMQVALVGRHQARLILHRRRVDRDGCAGRVHKFDHRTPAIRHGPVRVETVRAVRAERQRLVRSPLVSRAEEVADRHVDGVLRPVVVPDAQPQTVEFGVGRLRHLQVQPSDLSAAGQVGQRKGGAGGDALTGRVEDGGGRARSRRVRAGLVHHADDAVAGGLLCRRQAACIRRHDRAGRELMVVVLVVVVPLGPGAATEVVGLDHQRVLERDRFVTELPADKRRDKRALAARIAVQPAEVRPVQERVAVRVDPYGAIDGHLDDEGVVGGGVRHLKPREDAWAGEGHHARGNAVLHLQGAVLEPFGPLVPVEVQVAAAAVIRAHNGRGCPGLEPGKVVPVR